MILPTPGRLAPLWCVALFACGALVGVRAQEIAHVQPAMHSPLADTDPPSLAQAVEAAWKRTDEFQLADARLRLAQANAPAAQSTWAAPPALELSRRQESWGASHGKATETEAGLALPLWMPGQRRTRQAAQQAEMQLAQAGLQAGRHRIAGQVREAAWHVVQAQAQHDILAAQTQLLEALSHDVQRRVTAGELARTDAMAAQAEALAAQVQQTDAAQALANARLQWQLLTGLERIPAPADVEAVVADANPANHPELQFARLAAEHAHREWEAVDQDRRDPPELLLKVRRDAGGPNGGSQHSVGIGVRIPFGTDGRNAPKQAAARNALNRSQAAAGLMQARLTAEQQAARDALLAAQGQVETSRKQSQLLGERAQLLQRAFHAGEISLPELLRALSAATQAQAALARQQAVIGLSHARLQQTLGILP